MRRAVRTLPTAEAGSRIDPGSDSVLVFDVLRATTTLIHAFHNGAAEAWSAATVPAALRLADELSHAGMLLCGEREGRKIPGFDLGNSPLEYTRERVAGRPLVFASTNGSRALGALGPTTRAALGALVNAGAAASWAAAAPAGARLTLLCSGKEGAESPEDLMGAGAVLARMQAGGATLEPDAESKRALRLYEAARADLEQALRATPHGAYLVQEGFGPDLAVAAAEDSLRNVPEWNSGRLTPGREWPDTGP